MFKICFLHLYYIYLGRVYVSEKHILLTTICTEKLPNVNDCYGCKKNFIKFPYLPVPILHFCISSINTCLKPNQSFILALKFQG